MLTRRSFSGAILAMGTTGIPIPAFADLALANRLLEPGPLPERVFGNPDAPVTIVEYASVTCGFCAKFHVETWPTLKAKYVETGKVRFIIREFPLDPLAMAGFMLSRCADDDKWYPLLDRLYQTKEDWAHADNPVEAMVKTLSPYGMTPELFNSCVTRSDLFDKVYAVSERGKKEFGVNATPTFFINGVQRQGALTIQQFDEILAPMLAARP